MQYNDFIASKTFLIIAKTMQNKSPLILIILDGWGLNPERGGNAIAQAKTPTADELTRNYPHCSLQAAGISVGLPWGEVGNSEVGHLSLGSGRIIYQSLPRISMAAEDGSFFENPEFLGAINHAKKNKKPLHLMGLLSDGGVHSHINHLFALIKLANKNAVPIRMHIFTDGRDTDPKSAIKYVEKLENFLEDAPGAKISTIIGRSIAMDRNSRWNLTEKAYNCLTGQPADVFKSAKEAIEDSYNKGITDEFVSPRAIQSQNPKDDFISEGSSVIFFNFREDRARQITKAFIEKDFKEFERKKIDNIYFVCMTEYEKGLCGEHVAFNPIERSNCLAEVLSDNGLFQFHLAETEKYAHVTYFFNGGSEDPNSGEVWHLVPSHPDSAYEEHPRMSASKIAAFAEERIREDKYDFYLINFANADMVGHTGNLKSAIAAIEEVDSCLRQILKAGQERGASFIITADHGNAEDMVDLRTGHPLTDHTTNPVPCWIITPENQFSQVFPDFNYQQSVGILSDVAPTILDMLKIEKPAEMTGESLLGKL